MVWRHCSERLTIQQQTAYSCFVVSLSSQLFYCFPSRASQCKYNIALFIFMPGSSREEHQTLISLFFLTACGVQPMHSSSNLYIRFVGVILVSEFVFPSQTATNSVLINLSFVPSVTLTSALSILW